MVVTAGPVELATLATQEELDAVASEWDDLVRAMPRPTPFLLHGWVSEWWRHYGEGAELALHVARRGDALVGALPFFTRGRTGLRITEFLGGHTSALADLLLLDPDDVEAARGLADRAADWGQGLADLFGLPAKSRLAAALGTERLRLIERVEAPVLDLSAGWEATY